ncbi:MAG: DUF945 family protein [Thiotrichaceae bacterium]|nr:DUF945 family protein [Thiotrichaceae bacterium]
MKKIISLAVAGVLLTPTLVMATEPPAKKANKEAAPTKDAAPAKKDSPILGFTLQNKINNEAASPEQTLEASPIALFYALKNEVIAQLDKGNKPLNLVSTVRTLLSEEAKKTLGTLPDATLTTKVASDGKGSSVLDMPAFQRDVPLKKQQGKIDWKGITGKMDFVNKFESPKIDLVIGGATLSEGDELPVFFMDKTTYTGNFDADLMPLSAEFNMPSLSFGDKVNRIELQNVTARGKTRKAKNGLDLGEGTFNVALFKANDAKKDMAITMNDIKFGVITDEKADNNITVAVQSQIGKLLTNVITPNEVTNFSYNSVLEFRRLNGAALLEIQNKTRELRQQQGSMSPEMMQMAIAGKLMEVLPKLTANSPEIALSQLTIRTQDGSLEGNMRIAIDGKKPFSFSKIDEIVAALTADANFTITKTLINKLMESQAQKSLGRVEKDAKKPAEDVNAQAKAVTQQQLKSLVDQKYLVDAGDSYKFNLVFDGSKLLINNKDIPLPFAKKSAPTAKP